MTVEKLQKENMKEVIELIENHSEGRLLPSTIAEFKKNPEHFNCLIARKDNKIVGVTGYNQSRSFTVVHKDHRRQGIAERLIREKIKLNNGKLTTIVGATNIAMISLMLKLKAKLTNCGIGETGKPYLQFVISNRMNEIETILIEELESEKRAVLYHSDDYCKTKAGFNRLATKVYWLKAISLCNSHFTKEFKKQITNFATWIDENWKPEFTITYL